MTARADWFPGDPLLPGQVVDSYDWTRDAEGGDVDESGSEEAA
jgi:hypothetical protein